MRCNVRVGWRMLHVSAAHKDINGLRAARGTFFWAGVRYELVQVHFGWGLKGKLTVFCVYVFL